MKRTIPLLFLLFVATFAFAQTTQTGYVKTKGRMDSKGNLVPGTRIGNGKNHPKTRIVIDKIKEVKDKIKE